MGAGHMDATTLNILIAVVGMIITVIVGVVAYRLGIRQKEPCWSITTTNLIADFSSTLPTLKVEFEGKDVRNLSVSKVLIWNRGRETINDADLETGNDPFRIVASDETQILSWSVQQTNNDSCNLHLHEDPDGKVALIRFRYLNHGNGSVLSVVHTGTTSGDLHVMGQIRGAEQIRQIGSHSVFSELAFALSMSGQTSRSLVLRFTAITMIAFGFVFATSYFTSNLVYDRHLFLTVAPNGGSGSANFTRSSVSAIA